MGITPNEGNPSPKTGALDRDRAILDKLLEEAASSPNTGLGYIASALVYKKKFISVGRNSQKSHPFQFRYGGSKRIYFHGEVEAIHKATKIRFDSFEKSTLYVARVKWDSPAKNYLLQGLAKPCSGCMRCLMEWNVGRVVWTLDHNGYEVL